MVRLPDPIVELLITFAIFGIVWQSAKAVLTRMLDGVEPTITDQIRHAGEHIPGVTVTDAKARWIGHRLHADVAIEVAGSITVADGTQVGETFRRELKTHLPALATIFVRVNAKPLGSVV